MDPSPAVSQNVFFMEVKTAAFGQEPCLTFMPCSYCDSTMACASSAKQLTDEALTNQDLTIYGTSLEYHCDSGRQFQMSATETNETFTINCQWDQTWSPYFTIPDCICKKQQIIFELDIFKQHFYRDSLH